MSNEISTDLIKIKKKYGEEMMHMCAAYFPSVLEHEGLLFKIMSSLFDYSRFLYDDIVNSDREDLFREYILSLATNNISIVETDKTPFELMDEQGYILFECKDEDDVMKFKKYYANNESLCTFYNHRTKDHYVFFAVKKNVDDYKRDEFERPSREDEYGTSVISIQFRKGKTNFLSIKNRYNGSVYNPDATFSNNLENISIGLTYSFQKMYDLNIYASECQFDLPGYCLGSNGKLYKYNYFINGVYYCTNNVIVTDKEVINYEKEKYIIADYFIIDLVNKKIRLFDDNIEDSFAINREINKINVVNTTFGKTVTIYGIDFNIEFNLDQFNHIISYTSDLDQIGDGFLSYNKTLHSFNNNNLRIIGDDFLPRNDVINVLEIPNVIIIGNCFLEQNTSLASIDFPLLNQAGSKFMRSSSLDLVDLPNLEVVGDMFMSFNEFISHVSMPNLREVGNFFLNCNQYLESICLPSLEKVGNKFIARNHNIRIMYLPKLKYIGNEFLEDNKRLLEVILPSVLMIGNNFITGNEELYNCDLEKVVVIGDNFLQSDSEISNINMPNLIKCGESFIPLASNIMHYNFSSLEVTGLHFLERYNIKNKENELVKIK